MGKFSPAPGKSAAAGEVGAPADRLCNATAWSRRTAPPILDEMHQAVSPLYACEKSGDEAKEIGA